MRAELPNALEQEVAKQLDCILPAKTKRLTFRRKSLRKTDVMSKTIVEEDNSEGDDVCCGGIGRLRDKKGVIESFFASFIANDTKPLYSTPIN